MKRSPRSHTSALALPVLTALATAVAEHSRIKPRGPSPKQLIDLLQQPETRDALHRLVSDIENLFRAGPPDEAPRTRTPRGSWATPRPMRILIVGQLEHEFQTVKKACQGLAKLLFRDKDKNCRGLPEADRVILVTNFLSHTWQNAAFQKFGRERVHLHDGGVTTVVEKVKDLVRGEA